MQDSAVASVSPRASSSAPTTLSIVSSSKPKSRSPKISAQLGLARAATRAPGFRAVGVQVDLDLAAATRGSSPARRDGARSTASASPRRPTRSCPAIFSTRR